MLMSCILSLNCVFSSYLCVPSVSHSGQLEQRPVRLQSVAGLGCNQWGRQRQLWRGWLPAVNTHTTTLFCFFFKCEFVVHNIQCILNHVILIVRCLPAVTLWSRFQAVVTTVGLQRETGTTAPLHLPSHPWLNTLVSAQISLWCLGYHHIYHYDNRPVVFCKLSSDRWWKDQYVRPASSMAQ